MCEKNRSLTDKKRTINSNKEILKCGRVGSETERGKLGRALCGWKEKER